MHVSWRCRPFIPDHWYSARTVWEDKYGVWKTSRRNYEHSETLSLNVLVNRMMMMMNMMMSEHTDGQYLVRYKQYRKHVSQTGQ